MAEEAKSGQVDEILNDFNKKNSTMTILIIVFVIITLLGGAGAAYFFLFGQKKGEAAGVAPQGEPVVMVPASSGDKEMVGIINRLEPFIVNLNEVDASRYLKVAIELEVTDQGTVTELEKRQPQIRDICVGVLSSKSFSDIQGADGKYRLKEELMLSINKVLSTGQVKRIYFTQFVVQ